MTEQPPANTKSKEEYIIERLASAVNVNIKNKTSFEKFRKSIVENEDSLYAKKKFFASSSNFFSLDEVFKLSFKIATHLSTSSVRLQVLKLLH